MLPLNYCQQTTTTLNQQKNKQQKTKSKKPEGRWRDMEFKILVTALFYLLSIGVTLAQNSGISLGWTNNVSCLEFDDEKRVTLETISESDCLVFCQGRQTTFTLYGTLSTSLVTSWAVAGGTASAQDNDSVVVSWTAPGTGQLTLTAYDENNVPITRTICINIEPGPNINFTTAPLQNFVPGLDSCSGVPINFTNLSPQANPNSIINYLWDFGDGNTSGEVNPTHIYEEPGVYYVTLSGTNECNCLGSNRIRITVERRGFVIDCPGIVCGGDSMEYRILDGNECVNAYNWTVVNGSFEGGNNEQIARVKWDETNSSGFGYITFNPVNCGAACVSPTTIKVPVITPTAAIIGNTTICAGDSYTYSLPQWPSTEFAWRVVNNPNSSLANVVVTDQRNQITLTATQAGTITLVCEYRNTLIGCAGMAQLTINVKQTPVIQGAQTYTVGQTISLSTVPTTTVSWRLTNPSNTLVASSNNTTTFTNYTFPTAGIYRLRVFGNNLCEDVLLPIIVNSPPTPPVIVEPSAIGQNRSATSVNTLVCPGAIYSYEIDDPDPNSFYTWEVVGGTFVGSNNGIAVNVGFDNSSPTHLLTAKRTIIGQPASTAVQTTIVFTIIQINAGITNNSNFTPNLNNLTACQSTYVNYYSMNLDTPANDMYLDGDTYEWEISPPSRGSIVNYQGTGQVRILWNNVNAAATATLKLTVRRCNLVQVYSRQITILPTPTFTISSNSSACSLEPLTFTLVPNSNVPLEAGTPINWTFSNGLTLTTVAPTLSVTQTFNNSTESNHSFSVTATVNNPNSCSGVASASKSFVITSGSKALLTAQGNLLICPPAVANNATFFAGVTPGATVVGWYHNDILIPNTNGLASFTPNSVGLSIGVYKFQTSFNGCLSWSNNLTITQNCGDAPGCNLSPMPSLSFVAPTGVNCATLTLRGSHTGNPVATYYDVFGEQPALTNQAANAANNQFVTTVSQAGVYTCRYNAKYPVPNSSQFCLVSTTTTLTVPYVPDFKIQVSCQSNNMFGITTTDDSSILQAVTNKTYTYDWATSVNGPWTNFVPNTQFPQNAATDLTAGNYFIRYTISGLLNNVAQPPCSIIKPLNILPTPTNQQIIFTQPTCFDTPVQFSISNPSPDDVSFLWLFEPNVTNSVANPHRTFPLNPLGNNENWTLFVIVQITNKYGCVRTLASAPVNIPRRCYSGTTDFANTAITEACQGENITLKYTPQNLPNGPTDPADACTPGPNMYQWMSGSSPIVGETGSTIQVNRTGLYWVKVFNAAGCVYNTPLPVNPVFHSLPIVRINTDGLICSEPNVQPQLNASVVTDATSWEWLLDGNSINQDNQESINIANIAVGDHILSVAANRNGCTATATYNVTVSPEINAPILSYEVDCQERKIVISATNADEGELQWSTGVSGSSITTSHGGVYGVTYYHPSGCTATAEIDVPHFADKYLWHADVGCVEICETFPANIIGPDRQFFPGYTWLDGPSDLSGNSLVEPFFIPEDFLIESVFDLESPAGCNFKTDPIIVRRRGCTTCQFKDDYWPSTVTQISTPASFCAFNVTLTLDNQTANSLSGTFFSNSTDFVVSSAPVTFTPGISTVNLVVGSVNSVNSGSHFFTFLSNNGQRGKCTFTIPLTLPGCAQGSSDYFEKDQQQLIEQIHLVPNPVTTTTTLLYPRAVQNAVAEIYSLNGTLMQTVNLTDEKETQIDTSKFPQGTYILVLMKDNKIITRKKLIKN